MPKSTTTEADRRRSPRFVCSGYAHINCLPSTGVFLPGKIRDLSLGGCWVDTTLPIEPGARAEIVVRVNAASFRAVGEVRTVRGKSGAGLEFVQLTSGGKDLLSDLITDLAKLQAAMNQLKSSRRELDAESFEEELHRGKLQAMLLEGRFPLLGTTLPPTGAGENREEGLQPNQVAPAGNERPGKVCIAGAEPLVIRVDLFG